uniref:Uncharacterized protein n=1 Tax=viral metagenome TaxID=1070528 RepID=A0A6C0J8W5_9ZZZZ
MTDAILLIGAAPHEPHIIELKHNNPSYVLITVSNKHIDKENKSHFCSDFNEIDTWNNILVYIKEKNLHVIKIIVDWSTVRFFNRNYNIVYGKIFYIISNLVKDGAIFYSEYLTGIETMILSNNGVSLPNDTWYMATCCVPFIHQSLEDDPNITEYKKNIVAFSPLGIKTLLCTAYSLTDYPLHNKKMVYPFNYLKFISE